MPKLPKIIIESHVPFLDTIFEGVAQVERLSPEAITPEAVREARALIIRTRTRCDARLLESSTVRFIGTATIGTDHIDLPYCRQRGIEVVNAPGCNAPAVAQYVLASILTLFPQPKGLTLGVIGVGHVGSIVARWAQALGIRTLLCDPPRARREGAEGFSSLAHVAAEADILTFHTPLTRSGADATYHLADEALFSSLKPGATIINSSRGAVVDNQALMEALRCGAVAHAVVDTWEQEPDILPELLAATDIATPHIAGYSLQGKQRASQAVANALLRHLGSSRRLDLNVAEPPFTPSASQILASYNPIVDTALLRQSPGDFERLRNTYHLRSEPITALKSSTIRRAE